VRLALPARGPFDAAGVFAWGGLTLPPDAPSASPSRRSTSRVVWPGPRSPRSRATSRSRGCRPGVWTGSSGWALAGRDRVRREVSPPIRAQRAFWLRQL